MSKKPSTVKCLSNAVVNVPRSCWELWKQLISSNFQNGVFEIVTITMTKIILIQVFFLPLLLNKKIKKWKHGIPWHLHTIQKSALNKTRESHCSFVWVMERSIISLCLGKVKVFLLILACQSQSTFNVCMKTVNEFPVAITIKFKISCLFQASSSLTFRKL